MQDRTLLRIGAVSLIAGVVLTFVHITLIGAIEPADPTDMQARLQSMVDSPNWTGAHVFYLPMLLLFVGGLLALYRSFKGEQWASLARLGFAAALLGGAIISVSGAIYYGGAMKALGDAWGAAADKAFPFAVVEAMILVSFDIFSWGIVVFFGVAPILFGLGIALTDLYPKWLGWVAVIGGVGNALMGIVLFFQGWSRVTSNVWGALSIVITLWLLVMGVLMWRKSGAVANS
ncbi:MAG: DUF4386 family protein [Candidatus Zixiibacteriota bacterium]